MGNSQARRQGAILPQEPNSAQIEKNLGPTGGYQSVPTQESGEEVLIETEQERKQRRSSLWIIYLTVFVQCLGASVVITGMWPYLRQLDKDVSKEWFGGIVAANPLGQLIFAPLIGWWCARASSIRTPSFFCLGVFIVSNLWFALLPLAGSSAKYQMFAARFLVGISSGSLVVCRTFITQGTLIKERTAAVSYLSLCQSLGFILGPAVQVALTPLGKDGFDVGSSSESFFVRFNMYTAAGWVAAIAGCFNLILYHPKLFKESNIAIRETMAKQAAERAESEGGLEECKLGEGRKRTEEVDWSKFPPNYPGLASIFYTFFVVFFCYSLMEALATPVTMEQFGWAEGEAIRKVGMAMALSSILALACFLTIPPLSRRVDERKLLLGLGILPSILGRLFFFPVGGPVAPMREFGCITANGTFLPEFLVEADCEAAAKNTWNIVQQGCPPSQSWCSEIPALNVYLLCIGYALCTIGYPYTIVMPQTLFSKMLGARPQGVWMGALTAVTSLARVVGPITMTYTYTTFGTIATSGLALAVTVLAAIWLLLVHRKLVPFKLPSSS